MQLNRHTNHPVTVVGGLETGRMLCEETRKKGFLTKAEKRSSPGKALMSLHTHQRRKSKGDEKKKRKEEEELRCRT